MLAKRKNNKAWFLVLPVVIVVAFTAIIPIMTVANYSVQDVLSPTNRLFVGLEFFKAIANDPKILAAFQRNLVFSTQILLIEIPLGIMIAKIMPRHGWKAAAALVVVAIPLVIPWNVVGTTWRVFARPDVGLLGVTINQFRPFDIGNTPADAWFTMLLMDTWHWTPLVALLVYAGLRSIPQAYYQAAAIDSASSMAVFRFVELPKLRRVLMIAILLRFMDSFMIYAEPYILTGGGPGTATEVMSILLAVIAVIQFDLGRAAAFSLIYFLIIQIFSFILFTILTLDERPGSTKKTPRKGRVRVVETDDVSAPSEGESR
jgi:glycerol transport system permease protein